MQWGNEYLTPGRERLRLEHAAGRPRPAEGAASKASRAARAASVGADPVATAHSATLSDASRTIDATSTCPARAGDSRTAGTATIVADAYGLDRDVGPLAHAMNDPSTARSSRPAQRRRGGRPTRCARDGGTSATTAGAVVGRPPDHFAAPSADAHPSLHARRLYCTRVGVAAAPRPRGVCAARSGAPSRDRATRKTVCLPCDAGTSGGIRKRAEYPEPTSSNGRVHRRRLFHRQRDGQLQWEIMAPMAIFCWHTDTVVSRRLLAGPMRGLGPSTRVDGSRVRDGSEFTRRSVSPGFFALAMWWRFGPPAPHRARLERRSQSTHGDGRRRQQRPRVSPIARRVPAV